ncbi:hypothetical protein HYDPIDRAFT_162493 [Hydnomerulius pinastri MD-312]|uniref:Uncharacterized protein n=1 Tax=Hydnomerulius pinastri MD-312 TaxID=994086 RepID=A0A0C9V2A4_9AGAM|nr:hypothetical protein HYDPIDRAFT_162493 [Hydnomerulius pinastri MD-312]
MSIIQPPTSYLPPIAKIASFTSAQLLDALVYLKSLYRPEVRGSRRRRTHSFSFSKELSPSMANLPAGDDSDIQLIRSDAFERSYAIRWLTALIAQIEAWEQLSHDGHATPSDLEMDQLAPAHTGILIQQAASLLAICAGVAAAGTVQRVFSFDSVIAGKIEVQLTGIPLENQDYGSLGAQTWGGACVLSEMIVENPDRFGLGSGSPAKDAPVPERSFRVLELGAGTGLVGLTAAKLLQALPAWKNRRVTVVATDFHPSVLENLQSNTELNFSTSSNDRDDSISVTSQFLDWSSFLTTASKPKVLFNPFDVVFGADIIYEAQHAVWIRDCLKSLLRHPDTFDALSEVAPTFHLVIPLRPTHSFESSTIESVFPWKDKSPQGTHRELVILSKESILCEAHEGAGVKRSHADDDVEYVYYRIGWSI